MSSKYDVVIGLEIHAQLSTVSKCFSTASTDFSDGHNDQVTEVCAGLPGTLPVLNSEAVRLATKAGLALKCKIQKVSRFDRKQYFYPDMPKGYQITQLAEPIALGGKVEFFLEGKRRSVELERAHMEEDAGKSTHHGEYTLINLNRAGVPLLEIVSKPVMSSAKEAAAYARAVRQLLRYANVCDGNLEEGSLRCDCNISIKPKGQKELGTKVELKNLNSFRFIEKALNYEIDRQIQTVEIGETIIQETRLYDSAKNKTFAMRTKEEANDYRYFPDPDLLPLILSDTYIDKINSELDETPIDKIQRFIDDDGLSLDDAELLVAEKEFAEYYEKLSEHSGFPKTSCNWMTGDFLRRLNEEDSSVGQLRFSIEDFAELLKLIEAKEISGKIGKEVFDEMWNKGTSPKDIIASKGLVQITDENVLQKLVDQVISSNPKVVEDFRGGKDKLFGFFVGQVMKLSKGQASPEMVNDILKRSLKP